MEIPPSLVNESSSFIRSAAPSRYVLSATLEHNYFNAARRYSTSYPDLVIIPCRDPGISCVREQEIQVTPIGGVALTEIVEGVDNALGLGNTAYGRSVAIVAVAGIWNHLSACRRYFRLYDIRESHLVRRLQMKLHANFLVSTTHCVLVSNSQPMDSTTIGAHHS